MAKVAQENDFQFVRSFIRNDTDNPQMKENENL